MTVVDPTPFFYQQTDRLRVYGDRSYYKDDEHLTRHGADHYLRPLFDGLFLTIKKTAP